MAKKCFFFHFFIERGNGAAGGQGGEQGRTPNFLDGCAWEKKSIVIIFIFLKKYDKTAGADNVEWD